MPPLRLTKREYRQQFRAQLSVIGLAGQERLRTARVHICGTGGIGAQLTMYLAMAGVGHITVNDPQVLDWDNLNRFPMGTIQDLGMPKVSILSRFMRERPHVVFAGVQQRAGSGRLVPYYKQSDVIVCCSNTINSRRACVFAATKYKKHLVDVSVMDGRVGLSGCIRLYRPETSSQGACPMCFLGSLSRIRRGEGLLSTVISSTAAVAAHIVVAELLNADACGRANVINIDLQTLALETMAIRRRPGCRYCGHNLISKSRIGGQCGDKEERDEQA